MVQYQNRLNKHAQEGKRDPQLELYRWWLEEYRVSLFAQQLGTKVPISDKRLSKQWTLVGACNPFTILGQLLRKSSTLEGVCSRWRSIRRNSL